MEEPEASTLPKLAMAEQSIFFVSTMLTWDPATAITEDAAAAAKVIMSENRVGAAMSRDAPAGPKGSPTGPGP